MLISMGTAFCLKKPHSILLRGFPMSSLDSAEPAGVKPSTVIIPLFTISSDAPVQLVLA